MKSPKRQFSPGTLPRIAYRLEIAALMKLWGVDSKYRMAQILGVPNISHFYRYFSLERVPDQKYLWRMLHICRKIAQGILDLETFDPDNYWADIEEELIEREKNLGSFGGQGLQ